MKKHLNSFLNKAILKSTSGLACILVCASAIANDGRDPVTADVKQSVPVMYYQAFMIGLAVSYGIYLIVRAKRRKRNSKITE